MHSRARELVDSLWVDYEASRGSSFELLPGMTSFREADAPVSLTPVAATAAPIAIAFTDFPSLLVRYGSWHVESFPVCGCDACDETVEGEAERLEDLLLHVVAGRFREELVVPWIRQPRLRYWLGGGTGSPDFRSGWRTLPRAHATALGRAGRIDWEPWPKRRHP